jgi:hypothetical protein
MLPVIGGVLSTCLAAAGVASAGAAWGARLWVVGGVALSLALFAVAWRPRLLLLLPLPALAVLAGSVLIGWNGAFPG